MFWTLVWAKSSKMLSKRATPRKRMSFYHRPWIRIQPANTVRIIVPLRKVNIPCSDATVITGTFHSADPTTHTAIGHDETKIINFTVFQGRLQATYWQFEKKTLKISDKSMLEKRQNRRSSIAPLKDFAEFVKSVAATSTPRHSLATAGLFHPLDMSAIAEVRFLGCVNFPRTQL